MQANKGRVYNKLKASLKNKNIQIFQGEDGSWSTGPDGTYICTYVKDDWDDIIVDKMLQKLEKAANIPALIAKFITNQGGQWDGSNYLCKENQMRKALISVGFGLVSSTKDMANYEGSATEMTQSYFTSVLSALKGNVSEILTYLMQGMGRFQELTKKDSKQRSCSQLVITITARFLTPKKASISTNLKYIVSSTQVNNEVRETTCSSKQVRVVSGSYLVETYVQGNGIFAEQQIQID